jgi:hypothetical protein
METALARAVVVRLSDGLVEVRAWAPSSCTAP